MKAQTQSAVECRGPELMAAKPTPDLSSLCLAITEHAPLPMATVEGASHIVRYVNPAFCRLMDRPSEQLVGKPFCEMLPEKDECVTLLDRVYRTGKSESHTEQEHSKPHPVFWSFTMWPVLADERPVGVMIQVTDTAQSHEMTLAMNEALMLGSVRQHELTEAAELSNAQLQKEIAERKRIEEQIGILAREAEHRTKNVLATVQAIVHLTQSDTPDGLKHAIEGRIQALANVHALFVESRWTGAELHSLVTQELSPYCQDGETRARIDGPNLLLEPNTAQTIAVALHELATNAAKYGALSVPKGHVQVEWSRAADGRLVLRWTETGGPQVKSPTRKGFGTRVMEGMIRGQLKGEMRFDWHAKGLACEIAQDGCGRQSALPSRGEPLLRSAGHHAKRKARSPAS